jgi:rhodanese-related sulfurtransferase
VVELAEEAVMKKHTVALLVLLSAAAVGAQSMRAVTRATIDELKTLMTQHAVVIIDVRRPEEFAQGRIPGAININYTDIMGESDRFATEKRTIVTYCACVNETTAARAAIDLAARGVPGVKALKGGWNEWLERGEAIEK